MKKFSKVLAVLVIMLLGLTSTGVRAYADPTPTPTTPPTPGTDSQYAVETGESITFKKYLISQLGQVVPDLEFVYKISAGAGQAPGAKAEIPESWSYGGQTFDNQPDADNYAMSFIEPNDPTNPTEWTFEGQPYSSLQGAEDAAKQAVSHQPYVPAVEGLFEIVAGLEPEKVTVGTASFTDTDDKYPSVQTGDTVVLDEGEVYQKKVVTIDFSQVEFKEPGVYRYLLTEQEITGQTRLTYDTQRDRAEPKVRVIDVYVVDDGTGTLVIDKTTVLHEVASEIKTTEQLGSKDPNAVVAKAWKLDGVPTEYASYDHSPYVAADETSEESRNAARKQAEADRISLREKIHDDILTENDKIANLVDKENTAKGAWDDASSTAGIPALQTAYDNAKAARVSLQEQLTQLQGELAATTDPAEITRLRGLIDKLVAEGTPAPEGSIAEAQAVEDAAKDALDAAKRNVDALELDYENKKAAREAQESRVADLQALYNRLGPDCIKEIQWRLSDKSDGYVNEIAPVYDLQFHKKVTGNQGSRDKYFEFTVTIEGLAPNQLVTIGTNDGTISNFTPAPTKTAATTYEATAMKEANSVDEDTKWKYDGGEFDTEQAANDAAVAGEIAKRVDDTAGTTGKWIYDGNQYDTEQDAIDAATAAAPSKVVAPLPGQQLKADASGKIKHSFYLKHDEFVRLLDIKKDVTYTVTEVEEDYAKAEFTDKKAYTTTSPEIVELNSAIDLETDQTKKQALIEKRDAMLAKEHTDATSGTLNENKFTGYTNTRNGILPTGVAVVAGAGLAMLGIGMAGMYFFNKRKEEDEDEDDE